MDPRRLVIVPAVVIALGVVGVALVGSRGPASVRPPAAPRAPVVVHPPSPRVARDVAPPERTVLAASLPALGARLDARWSLRPDARFALALRHLATLETANAPAPEVRPSRDGWSVTLGPTTVATLPAEVTCDAMITAAVAFATVRDLPTQLQLTADPHPPGDALDAAMVRDPWAAARALDARWTAGPHRATDVASLGRALALTVALTPDPLGVGDAVAGRALAALALARSADAPDPAGEALLCHAMTYVSEARARSEAIAATHRAVYAWVHDDPAALRSLMGHGDVAARRLLEARDVDSAGRADLAGARRMAEDIPGRVLTSLERDEGAMSGTGAAAFARFSALESAEATGAWIDGPVTTARRRARWGDGLMRVLSAAQAAAETPTQAQEVIGLLGTPSDPLDEAWLSWARQYIVAGASASARASLAHNTGAQQALGVPVTVRSLRVLVAEGLDGSTAVRAAVERLASQMDQRPAHRLALGSLLLGGVCDVPRAEVTLAAGAAQGPGVDPAAVALLHAMRGDRAALLALASSGAVDGRIAALRALAHTTGPDGAAQDEAWTTLADDADDSAEVAVQRSLALVDRHELARAKELLEHWDASHRSAPSAARVAVVAALGDVLLKLRDLPGAWRVLEPWASSDSVAALSTGARALVELERFEEAERLARRAWDRDEHASTAALLAEVCWRRTNNAGAADALAPRVRAMDDRTWETTVGQSFDAVFSGRSSAEGKAALGALPAEVDVLHRAALLMVMLRAGHGGIAAEIHESLRAEGNARLGLLLVRYAMRAASEGELPAGEWLQGEVPATERAELAEQAYPRRLDEVLWGVVETPPPGPAGDRVWLLRAAASLRRGGEDPHRADLLEYLRGHDAGTWASTLARHLFDLATLADVRAQAETPEQEWQTGYYLGLKAQAAGELAGASDWFHGALDPADDAPAETRWAMNALREWARVGQSLAHREGAAAE